MAARPKPTSTPPATWWALRRPMLATPNPAQVKTTAIISEAMVIAGQ